MKRRGSTLIELAISLPIFSMLMVLTIGGVHQVMKVSRLAKNRGQLAYGFAKLEQSIRADVHQAESAKVVRNEKTDLLSLYLSLPDGIGIVYRVRTMRIEREHVDIAGMTRADSFALFAENRVRFDVEGNQTVLVSVYRVHRDHSNAARLELFVRSKIGRPHLLAPLQHGAENE